ACLVVVLVVIIAWMVPVTHFRELALISILGVVFVSILPDPAPRFARILDRGALGNRAKAFSGLLKTGWTDMISIMAIVFRGAGLSIPERTFLEAYSRAETMIRVLECDLLSSNLQRSIRTAYETLTSRVFDAAFTIVRNL